MKAARARLLTVVAFLLCAAPGPALEVRDVIHLLDGSTVEGVIIERVPGVSYAVETRREVVTVPVGQIDRIRKLSVEAEEVDFSYRDVVVLKAGLILRGTIVEEEPGSRIVLLTEDGLSLSFAMSDIWRIAAEKCAAGQSRRAIGEHPTGTDLRRAFRIELTIQRIEDEEAAGRGEEGRLSRLREELAALETEKDVTEKAREEGQESIDRLREQISGLEDSSSALATEVARRALECAAEEPAAREAALAAYEVVQSELGSLHTTALQRTEVDPRLLTQQIALEHEMRRVELTALLTPPLPPGRLDPTVASLVPTFPAEERQQLYEELRLRPRLRYGLLNLLLPVGAGSFAQGDFVGGAIVAGSMVTGFVLLLDAATGWTNASSWTDLPLTFWMSAGMMGGGYLYSLTAPSIFRNRQNQRLEDALRPREQLEADL